MYVQSFAKQYIHLLKIAKLLKIFPKSEHTVGNKGFGEGLLVISFHAFYFEDPSLNGPRVFSDLLFEK